MIYEVDIYLGSACITAQSNEPYPIGERHAFLLYLKANEDGEHDLLKAEKVVADLDFDQIEFKKVGKLAADKTRSGDKKEHYDHAMEFGSTFIFYEDPM